VQLCVYLSSVWATRSEWASCFQLGLPARGSNTISVEVVFKVVTYCIIDLVLVYSVSQLRGIIPLTSNSNYSNHMIMTCANNFCDRFTKNATNILKFK